MRASLRRRHDYVLAVLRFVLLIAQTRHGGFMLRSMLPAQQCGLCALCRR